MIYTIGVLELRIGGSTFRILPWGLGLGCILTNTILRLLFDKDYVRMIEGSLSGLDYQLKSMSFESGGSELQ